MSRSLTAVYFGLILLSLQNVAEQLSFHPDNDVLSKLAVFEEYFFIGGGKNLYKLNATLEHEETIQTCTSNCTNSVNQLLLINENKRKVVICGTGNDGLCSQLDLYKLGGEHKTGSLKVPVDPRFPAVGLVTEDHKELMVARSVCANDTFLKETNIKVIASWNFEEMKIPDGLGEPGSKKFLKLKTSPSSDPLFCIKYLQVLEHSNFSYFFTNQNKYFHTQDKVSKVARICQKDASYQTYIDAEITCQVGHDSYNILTDAVLVNDKVFASFSKSNGRKSIICFKDIRQLKSSLDGEKLDFINGRCVLDINLSYLDYDNKYQECSNPQNLTKIAFQEFTCDADIGDITDFYQRVIGKRTIPFKNSSHIIDGYITKLFTTTVNQKTIILAGTDSGHVIQFSILEDDSLHKYDTSSVPVRTSREDNQIYDLYHFPDGNALYALTKSKISKINARSCSETGVSVCIHSETMKLKDPHCGWCVFKHKLSEMSICNDTWISSVDGCITLSISPQGVKVGESTASISINPDKLPIANYTCAIYDKNATARSNGSSLTCSVDVSEISANHRYTTFGLYEKTKNVLVAETPFLFFNCSVYSKCGQCVKKAGAQCSWCPVQGVCVDEEGNCTNSGDPRMNWQVNQTDGCPRLKNNNEHLYIHNGQKETVHIKVENLDNTNHLQGILVEFSNNNETCNYTDDQISCSLNYEGTEVVQKKNQVTIRLFYLYENSTSEFEDDFNNTVTVYDCGELGKRGCNFCKALSCRHFKCHWNNSTKSCAFTSSCGCARNNTSRNKCNSDCPDPNITEISPDDGPLTGFVSVTVIGNELGVNTQNLTEISICGKKSDERTLQVWDDSEDKSDFDLKVRTGFIYYANTKGTDSNQLWFNLGGHYYKLPVAFKLKNSILTDFSPKSGLEAGGTRVTLYGSDLGIGNQVVEKISIGTGG
ncbi:plexin-A4-like isoform X1 [Mya arenaria]|uniref:plexin-A4-like isoform X1 n=1 Tax=Mya arenaria TaxID=6604 RepID=UPI0022E40363|nr:plexin-A4-like isoform X1 [Mya arenaria]XP_052781263.1 plexin-A4-like isoform X1 [Mya arenaria]XP_052781264.1 plexin-A4-like isoform X1 [Mya arenaria]